MFLSWGLYLSVGFCSVSAMDSMSGTLVFLVWGSLSGSISIVVVSVIQPSKAKVLIPTEVMLWRFFTLPYFPEAIVAIARLPQGWISSMTSGRINKAVVMVGMILSRLVVSMMELGIEMDWSQVDGGSGSFRLGASFKRFLNVDL